MTISTTKKDVAQALLGLQYTDMLEIGENLVGMIKSGAEEQIVFDVGSRDCWCDRLRWWAENLIDAED